MGKLKLKSRFLKCLLKDVIEGQFLMWRGREFYRADPICEYSPCYATLCTENSSGIDSVKYLKMIDLNPLSHIISVMALFSTVEVLT